MVSNICRDMCYGSIPLLCLPGIVLCNYAQQSPFFGLLGDNDKKKIFKIRYKKNNDFKKIKKERLRVFSTLKVCHMLRLLS